MPKAFLEPVKNDLIVKQVALAALDGASVSVVAGRVGLTETQVKNVQKSPEFNKALAEIAEECIAPARNKLRTAMSKMADDVVRVLQKRLEKEDLEAVKVILKNIGMEQEEQAKNAAPLQVFLPGAPRPEKVIPHDDSLPD